MAKANDHVEEGKAMKLSGKVALVTGSTSGIGLGIARALADSEAHVMLNGFGDKALIDGLVACCGRLRQPSHACELKLQGLPRLSSKECP